MKIALVIGSVDKIGGAERVLISMANYWVKKNKSVTIYTLSNAEYNDKQEAKKISKFAVDRDVVISNCFETKNIFLGKFSPFYNLYKSIKSDKPNIIISFIKYPNIFSSLIGKALNIPVIISERTDPVFDTFGKELFLKRLTYKMADAIVLQTNSVKQSFKKLKITFPAIQEVINNPLSSDFLIEEDLFSKSREKIIIAVGRLCKEKGYDNLIKAFSLVDAKDWQLQIIGRNEGEKTKLETIIKDLNLSERVKLLGEKSDVKEYYRRASIFSLSSLCEGFPNVLCEAMAMGCACVSVDCTYGPSEIISNNKNGLLVPSDSLEALAEGMQCLINDQELRMNIGNEALTIRKELNITTIIQKWDDLINRVSQNIC